MRSVTLCRAPSCGGEVTVESVTDGHCLSCGLRHRRRAGTAAWAHVIGPLVVTVRGAVDGVEETIDADLVRFVAKYMTVEVTRGAERYMVSVPARRLANIVPRGFDWTAGATTEPNRGKVERRTGGTTPVPEFPRSIHDWPTSIG